MFFLFIPVRDIQDASADRRKILHGDQTWAEFYNASPKFRGALPEKNSGAKTC